MISLRALATSLSLLVIAPQLQAADFSDPTWPCVQRKVETLSLGLMWPFPVDGETDAPDGDLRSDVQELGALLALRRVEPETLEPQINAFAETYQGDPQALGLVFANVFDTLSNRRARIMRGIGDFSLGQIALAEKIDAARGEMNAVLTAAEPDFDKADLLEEQLDWDQVIYTDRQRNIAYLCETPTLIERRLFSIAQMLQKVAQQ